MSFFGEYAADLIDNVSAGDSRIVHLGQCKCLAIVANGEVCLSGSSDDGLSFRPLNSTLEPGVSGVHQIQVDGAGLTHVEIEAVEDSQVVAFLGSCRCKPTPSKYDIHYAGKCVDPDASATYCVTMPAAGDDCPNGITNLVIDGTPIVGGPWTSANQAELETALTDVGVNFSAVTWSGTSLEIRGKFNGSTPTASYDCA